MPMYEYKCSGTEQRKCNKRITVFRHFKDRNNPETCTCGGKMKRVEIPKGGLYVHWKGKGENSYGE